jgi:hypothetical protein
MVTLFASTAPCRIELQEMLGHIATLEQAMRAVHEDYLGPPYTTRRHTRRSTCWCWWRPWRGTRGPVSPTR